MARPPRSGGCLCGALRYEVTAVPYYVAVCSCRFCQRVTGSDYNVESMFRVAQVRLTQGRAARYSHVSEGSGQPVHLDFCAACGTTVFLVPERFPDCIGIFSGSFDDPEWFERSPATTGYFFTESAPRGMTIPAGHDTYPGHARALDGSDNPAIRLDAPRPVTR